MVQWLSVLFFLSCLASPAFGDPGQGTLEKIKSAKVITMGYREASLPFSYVGDDKKPVGYAVDLCTRVAAGEPHGHGRERYDRHRVRYHN